MGFGFGWAAADGMGFGACADVDGGAVGFGWSAVAGGSAVDVVGGVGMDTILDYVVRYLYSTAKYINSL
ncbi:hypothetical protein ASD86_21760 [Lysobacter sp. Root690]|nr:hypothetical protein ASD86_21760 [Lysobacter sp. Root690]